MSVTCPALKPATHAASEATTATGVRPAAAASSRPHVLAIARAVARGHGPVRRTTVPAARETATLTSLAGSSTSPTVIELRWRPSSIRSGAANTMMR